MKFSDLTRIYINERLSKNQIIKIKDDNFHYLKSVMRLRNSGAFRIFNSIDGEYLVKIIKINRSELEILIQSLLRSVIKEKPLSLAMCIIKPDRMLEAIKAAVQLGTSQIIPIVSERTQYKKIAKDRVEKCIIQATEQSERFLPTKLLPVMNLSDFCINNNFNQIIAAIESENIDNNISNINKIESNTAILIGPEGGFSDAEINTIKSSKNMTTISLGNSVLRSEIAAIAAISYVSTTRTK